MIEEKRLVCIFQAVKTLSLYTCRATSQEMSDILSIYSTSYKHCYSNDNIESQISLVGYFPFLTHDVYTAYTVEWFAG